jgi:hypothetical protein
MAAPLPARNAGVAAGGITTVTRIRRAGILRQHPRGKNSRSIVSPERAMSLVEQPPPRSRSQQPLPVLRGPEPGQALSRQRRIALVWSSETAIPARASGAMTRLTAAAAARIAGYAGGDVLHILLAVLSWLAMEFLHGCAAYARAMYPPIESYDPEWESAEYEAARPVTPAEPGRSAKVATAKPRLAIAVSNAPSTTTSRSGRQ